MHFQSLSLHQMPCCTVPQPAGIQAVGFAGEWPALPTHAPADVALLQAWRVYQRGLERWLADLLQPVFDNLIADKSVPRFVQRLRILEFTLDHEAPYFDNMRRRSSRKDSDLNGVVDVRYTGGARMLLQLEVGQGRWRIKVTSHSRGHIKFELKNYPNSPLSCRTTAACVMLYPAVSALHSASASQLGLEPHHEPGVFCLPPGPIYNTLAIKACSSTSGALIGKLSNT